jgi:hypothetical protein
MIYTTRRAVRQSQVEAVRTGKNRLPKNRFYQRRIIVSLRRALELT